VGVPAARPAPADPHEHRARRRLAARGRDLTNNPATGAKSWHTVLTFQTGFSVGGKPAAYALDVTDPASPVVLWEYTTPAAPTALDLGTGLVVAAGSVRTSSGGLKNIAVLETSNGGTGGTGVVTTAVSQETGEKLWQFGYAYPTPPRGVAADLPLATTGIPGGAAAVDLAGKGLVTDIVFGDLYGNLWRLDATTGTSRNGATTPVFSFSTNKHPIGAVPAIYSDGSQQFAAFASGGYVDPTATSWTTTTQYLIAIKLSSTAATISETTAACASCALAIKQTLTTGDKGFSQALVVGTQLFLTTDSADVNQSGYGTSANTGHVMTFDLTGGSPTTVVVNSGGASLASAGTTLYSSSSNGQQRLATAATTTAGTSVVVTAVARIVRQLWLRSK
jgi:type IV pilus assembly protein PilY1